MSKIEFLIAFFLFNSLNCVTSEIQIYYYHAEQNGMPVMLTDAEGRVSWQQQSQSLWGTITANHNLNTDNPVSQPLRFAGQYFDNETGLHYNTFRYYDPQAGRFTQPDPIGILGGLNLYQYASNPLSWIDPLGLACHGHHSDPKFAGGEKNQPLTKIDEVDHRQLHKELNDFLVNKTTIDSHGKTVHMRPQRGNSGRTIRRNFLREELLDALAEFYKKDGAKYINVVEDFFKQHPELK